MIKKVVEIGNLFDFYGKLLSRKQYTAIELYYIHDLSLTEIGEELGISRQGVYDTLKRAEEKLYQYEDTLKLVNKFYHNRKDIDKIYKLTKDIEKEVEILDDQKILQKTKDLKSIIEKIIDKNQEVVN